jgi:hypothetical protein
MDAGEYTIEVTDASGKQVQKIEHTIENRISRCMLLRLVDEDKYFWLLQMKILKKLMFVFLMVDNNLVHNESTWLLMEILDWCIILRM